MRVRRRHIIYVQGYDPRGLAQYYRMFRTELRKSDRLSGLSSRISRPRSSTDDTMASWTIATDGGDWQTDTTYDFLRWEDLIQRDMAAPIRQTVLRASAIYWRLVVDGTIARFWRAHWRFATFISYPHFVLLNEILWSLIAAFVVWFALTAAGAANGAAIAAGIPVFAAALWALLKYTEKRTYLLYLMSDTIFTWQFAHRERPDWDARIARFAAHLVETAKTSDADEIIVVGHSSGSFLGVEIMAQALELDPALGRHGPRLALLTIGGNLPIVGFLPVSGKFRERLGRLATEPALDWIDGQSRKDVMNFYPFDPVAGHGLAIAGKRHNPTIMPVRFREIIDPARYNRFRWQFFRVHFQFVMANERPNAYDFFMIVRGPVRLLDRARDPAGALAAVHDSAPSAAKRDGNLGHRERTEREQPPIPQG